MSSIAGGLWCRLVTPGNLRLRITSGAYRWSAYRVGRQTSRSSIRNADHLAGRFLGVDERRHLKEAESGMLFAA